MERTKRFQLSTEKLILEAVTEMVYSSFGALSGKQKKDFASFSVNSNRSSNEKIGLRRRLWDFQASKKPDFRRAVLRFDMTRNGCRGPKIFVKAGLTDLENCRVGKGLAISFGSEIAKSAEFSRNMVTEMNCATDGVEIFYRTPGEECIMGRLKSVKSLENYLGH